jgi:hypothetical protein
LINAFDSIRPLKSSANHPAQSPDPVGAVALRHSSRISNRSPSSPMAFTIEDTEAETNRDGLHCLFLLAERPAIPRRTELD